MKKKPDFWNAQRTAFVNSFKRIPTKRFLYSALFDFLCLLAFFIIVTVSLGIINAIGFKYLEDLNQAYQLKMSGEEEALNDMMLELAPAINKLLILSLVLIIVGFVLIIFFCSLLYGKAWYYALKKKYSTTTLKQYFKLNLVWCIIIFLILFITAIGLRTSYVGFIILFEILIFYYLDHILRSVFDEKKTIGENLKAMLRTAKHVGWLLWFIILTIILMIILLSILNLITSIPILFTVAFIIVMLFFMGWSRNYIIELVEQVKAVKKI